MDFKQFTKEIEKHEKEIDTLARRRFPAKVAAKAERHYRGNFSRGGFLNNGHHPWKTTKRQMSGGEDAASKYGPLLSGREHLRSSVIGESMPYRARVYNRVPYAAIHNFGGTFTIHPAVTPKMRRFGWAKYREAGGKDNPEASGRWKALALTKKARLDINITIPQRQFIGRSAELEAGIWDDLDKELENILNK
jgi:phage gpG-like protein